MKADEAIEKFAILDFSDWMWYLKHKHLIAAQIHIECIAPMRFTGFKNILINHESIN